MKPVYSARDPLDAHLIKELLSANGIDSVINDERIFALAGEVPVVYPSVCVRDEDSERAKALVSDYEFQRKSEVERAPWKCAACGELNAGTFEVCWKCESGDEPTPPRDDLSLSKREKLIFRLGIAIVVGIILAVIYVAVAAKTTGLMLPNRKDRAWQHYEHGLRLLDLSRIDSALHNFEQAVALRPTEAEFYAARGWSYYVKGDHERAANDTAHALNLFPNCTFALYTRATLLTDRKDYAAALEVASRTITLDPARSENYSLRAWAHFGLLDTKSALNDFANALTIDPQNVYALASRADLYFRMGNIGGAKADALAALKIKPHDVTGTVIISAIESEAGDNTSAEKRLREALRNYPQNFELTFSLAWVEAEKGDHKAAIALLQSLRTDPRNSAVVLNNLLYYARVLGDRNLVQDVAVQLADIRASDYLEVGARGHARVTLGRYDEGIADCKRSIELQPWDRWGYFNLASMYCLRAVHPPFAAQRDNDLQLALQNLELAVNRGLAHWVNLGKAPDLKPLHEDVRFKNLLSRNAQAVPSEK